MQFSAKALSSVCSDTRTYTHTQTHTHQSFSPLSAGSTASRPVLRQKTSWQKGMARKAAQLKTARKQ